ncbi:FkbM family methyltransferase [Agrobacterium cavarae]|uniref:FkbM family methyltransferase n=1 Tax=Agrobacterium cavarae TaxID=2528239 RepID=UPI003FD57EC9
MIQVLDTMDFIGHWSAEEQVRAERFCHAYLSAHPSRRYVFGRNVYARAVAEKIEVAAFVDDFTDLEFSDGRPIIKSVGIPADGLVLVASGGMPLRVTQQLNKMGRENLDYFAFFKWSGLELPEAVFNEDFAKKFEANYNLALWLYDLLEDDESRSIFRKLVCFKTSYNIRYLEGFQDRQKEQYFEHFLRLNVDRPVFYDVGGFDGYTSQEFINHVPDYNEIFVFEPDQMNEKSCRDSLKGYRNVSVLPYGAGSANESLRFSQAGSASSIDPNGDMEIQVRRLDDEVKACPTYIKMDIEGAELDAIAGARETIRRCTPNLAICVYHRPSDLWDIPRAVTDITANYRIYLRHYTESIYETVMYFVPREEAP